MFRWSRRHFIATALGLNSTGCHLVRLGLGDKEPTQTVGDALKATKPGGHPLDGPRRVAMKIAILDAPLRSKAIDESIWNTADEQVITGNLRDSLRNNGLRIGLLRSNLPTDVQTLMETSGPAGQKVEPLLVNQPVNEPTKIAMGDKKPESSLLMDIGGKIQGKTYRNVNGFLRLSGELDSLEGVIVKCTPELHHGEIKTSFASAGMSDNPFEPAQLTMKSGQTEELFRDLSASVRIMPNQCLVIGLDSAREGGLGWFLLTDPATADKEPSQRMILVWVWHAGRETNPIVPALASAAKLPDKRFEPMTTPPNSPTTQRSDSAENKANALIVPRTVGPTDPGRIP